MKQTNQQPINNLNDIQITALEAAANGVVITDKNGVIIWVNPAVTNLTGFTVDELVDNKTSIFKSNQHPLHFYQELWKTISAGKVWRGEIINRKKDGSFYNEDMTITPVLNKGGKITNYIAIKQDITAFRTAVEEQRSSEERFRRLINSVHAHFYISKYSADQGFSNQYLSENIVELTGYPLDKFMEDWNAWGEIVHPDDSQIWTQFIDHLASGKSGEIEYRIIQEDGKTIWVSNNAQVTAQVDGDLVIYATVTDITERKQAENRIRHLATHDPLTNLPNRIMFREILEHAISFSKRNQQKLAVFFLDVNNFKTINDTYGHHMGDKLLIAIADRLRSSLREYDTVSRISGDEFTLITQQLKQSENAIMLAEKIYTLLDGDYHLHADPVKVSVSVGGSIFPEHGTDYETLIHKADRAMYEAKYGPAPHFRIFRSTS